MKITDSEWELKCSSPAQKRNLLDVAKLCSVSYRNDDYNNDDLTCISYSPVDEKLFCFGEGGFGNDTPITALEFVRMCEDFNGGKLAAMPYPFATAPASSANALPMDYIYGLNLIHDERENQVVKGRSTVGGDDRYFRGELHDFARYWLTTEYDHGTRQAIYESLTNRGWQGDAFDYLIKTPEERLAIAGALIAAELDRLNRAKK